MKAGMNIMPLEVSLLSDFNFVFSVLLTCQVIVTCYKAVRFCSKNVNLSLMATFLQYVEQHGGHIKSCLSYGLTLNRS